jgi:CheY-like chemotaxis protein
MKTILIIDDKAAIVENLAEFLELHGYTVISANNGMDGLALAQSHLPDLIVCDILMPRMDGHTVLFILLNHSETCKIPFVFSTAKSESSDRENALALGAMGYLIKPYDPFELLNLVETLLRVHVER